MHITLISGLDLSVRLLTVGQLLLAMVLLAKGPVSGRRASLLCLAVCVGGYLLLTAPIPDERYGLARNLLLALTDALAYSLWFTAMYLFVEDFRPSRWPRMVKASLGVLAFCYLYVFVIRQGSGVFHDINHFLSILVLGHVIFVATRGWQDDLLSRRRQARVLVILMASVYGILLASVELLNLSLKSSALFGLSNSLAWLVLVPLFSWFVPANDVPGLPAPPQRKNARRPSKEGPLLEKVEHFLQTGGYLESGVTVKSLAVSLGCPEYRLRRVINTELGYNNFSGFLNHYRLAEARRRLVDQPELPVLTLAMELGYGSIGPFNRAFKAEVGCTPTEYRRDWQNRP